MVHVPSLQSVVDRYAKSLAVPHGLQQLHERNPGRPKQPQMTLAPAIVLTSVSAFEGFVEEFVAVVGAARGLSFAQIVKLAHTNTPSLRDFQKDLLSQLGGKWSEPKWQQDYRLELFKAPSKSESTNWWRTHERTWTQLLDDADGWLQVRHCLIHGLTRGYLGEVWPGPVKPGVSATAVLKEVSNGRHSLNLHGAINCSRVLRYGAEALSIQASALLNQKPPRWRAVPRFPLVEIEIEA